MRVGFFGGSFDPPHRGHLAVACAARDRFALDRVLLAPTGRQPLKPGGATASFADRLAMTRLLCEGQPALEASTLDAPTPGGAPNYTADTLRRLHAKLPTGAEVFAILGADAFLGLPQWHDRTALFDLAEWVVVSRPGFSEEQLRGLALEPAQWARVHLLSGVHELVSATALRVRLHAGEPCRGLVPPAVLAYLERHRVYAR